MNLDLGEDPARWIPHAGKPAACLDVARGMPAYESDDESLLIMETVIGQQGGHAGEPRGGAAGLGQRLLFFPRSYGRVAIINRLLGADELLNLHDDPDAWHRWRPVPYQNTDYGTLGRFGSQQELDWRDALGEVEERQIRFEGRMLDLATKCLERGMGHADFTAIARVAVAEETSRRSDHDAANDRAGRVLRENLCPQQRIDLEAWGRFYVRGAVNQLYAVRPGNGFAIVHPETRQELASVCLHPEYWMPHDDVALSVKLLVDAGPRGEEELLAGGRVTWIGGRTRAHPLERRAWDVERHLLPGAPE